MQPDCPTARNELICIEQNNNGFFLIFLWMRMYPFKVSRFYGQVGFHLVRPPALKIKTHPRTRGTDCTINLLWHQTLTQGLDAPAAPVVSHQTKRPIEAQYNRLMLRTRFRNPESRVRGFEAVTRMNEWMNEWIDKWKDEWMNRWMHERIWHSNELLVNRSMVFI